MTRPLNTQKIRTASQLLAGLMLILLVSACQFWHSVMPGSGGNQPSTVAQRNTTQPVSETRRFETAIANHLFGQAGQLAHLRDAGDRLAFLERLATESDRAVNFSLTDAAARRDREILAYLIKAERIQLALDESPLLDNMTLQMRFEQRSSLPQTIGSLEQEIEQELTRIAQLLRVFGSQLPAKTADLSYPADTEGGRQEYLDQLADHLYQGQWRNFDGLQHNKASEMILEGFEDPQGDYLFAYDRFSGALHINLWSVANLPAFEIESRSIYFGFPGLHSLWSRIRLLSIQRQLQLPAFTHGWSWYVTDYFGTRDTVSPSSYLEFSRMLCSLALVDLKVNSGQWSVAQAQSFLEQSLPLTKTRVENMILDATARPASHLAAFAGRQKFMELHDKCLTTQGCSTPEFHQTIFAAGPMPFEMLEAILAHRFSVGVD